MGVKRNLIANFAGRIWMSLFSFVFLPIYIRLLGVEAYGLVTVFISLSALIQVLDFGMSTLINRELARLTAEESNIEGSAEQEAADSAKKAEFNAETKEGKAEEARDLVRTLEGVYWLIGVAITLVIVAGSVWAAHHWVHPKGLSTATVAQTLALIGGVFAFLWPDTLYAGALMGLHRQVQMNIIRISAITLQYLGAVLILQFVSHTIQAFFCWQVFIFAIQTVALRVAVWRYLPSPTRPARFDRAVWSKNWRFAAGMTGLTLLATLLSQMDRIVLSKMLTLDALGYYGASAQLASALTALVGPILSSVFPAFSRLAAQNKTEELTVLYHKSCHLAAAIIVPVWLTTALFSRELLTFYIHDPVKIDHMTLLLSLLATGTALNALVTLPLGLQLAYGWTKLSLVKNAVAIVLFVPLLLWATARYGVAGAAAMSIVLNLGYLLLEVPIMHSRLLRGELARFYGFDVGLPLLLSLIVLLVSRSLLPAGWPLPLKIGWIIATCALAGLACAWTGQRLNPRRAAVTPVQSAA